MKSFLPCFLIVLISILQPINAQNLSFDVNCNVGTQTTNFCYNNNETTTLTFTSSSGVPVILEFLAGTIESGFDDITVYDGSNNSGAVLFTGDNGGDLAGLNFESSGDSIFIEIDSDGSISCQSSSTFTPWEISYTCVTCLPATATYDIMSNCASGNDEFFVEVIITDAGDAENINILDNQGSPVQTTTVAGTFTFGPYPNGTQVNITVEDADDLNCILDSGNLSQDFCPQQECDIINAGPNAVLDCTGSISDVNLSATFMTSALTTNTSVYLIDDLECPLSNLEGTPTGLSIDDRWSQPIDLGFEFEFFGITHNQVVAGANGLIGFDTSLAGNFCPWSFEPNELIPTPDLPTDAIFGPYHDIDPSRGGQIEFTTVGTAPERQFKLSFVHVPHFSCNELLTTSQIILYESSNVIDVIILEKPTCQTWNDGLATVGVQNSSGTVGYSPAGRNTGDWVVSFQELWRFIPDGPPNYVFEWFDDQGNSLGNNTDITVSPTSTTVYTATVTYTDVNGQMNTVSDDVTVSVIDQTPTPGQPDDLTVCSTNGTSIFDLTIQNTTIINGQSDVTVTYYEVESDAIAGNNAITNPSMYESSLSPQTIYFRLESDTSTTCFVIGNFDLIQNNTPNAGQPNDLTVCTTGVSSVFDLTVQDTTIINGQSDLTVSYYEMDVDAVAGNNAIVDPTMYESTTSPQTIYFRLESNTNSACFTTGSFDLIQNSIPVAGTPDDLIVCTNDVSSIFDLTVQDTIIINGETGATVSYHEDENDALAGNNAITNPSMYESTLSPQTIYFRLESNTNNDCFSTGSFDLIQDNIPTAGLPDDLTVCSTGISSIFDLTTQDTTIINGETAVTVTYYEDENDAMAGNNTIADPSMYESTLSPQTIYFRLESNTNSDCFSTGSFNLIQNSIPTAGLPNDLTNCSNSNGSAIFDLSSQSATIINGQADVGVSYYENQTDADAAINEILNPSVYENLTSPQTIYYRLENNNATDCFTTGSFLLNISVFDTNLIAVDQGCEGNDYIMSISPINSSYDPSTVSYEWFGPIGASTTNNTSSTFTATVDGEYFVEITTDLGCVYTKSVFVENAMCVFPQGISPNADSRNDNFDLSAFNVLEIEIFNRLGRLVYKKENYTNEWFGQSDNGELPVGTYFYVAQLENNESRSGWVYIQR